MVPALVWAGVKPDSHIEMYKTGFSVKVMMTAHK